jgi:hypothetical protein
MPHASAKSHASAKKTVNPAQKRKEAPTEIPDPKQLRQTNAQRAAGTPDGEGVAAAPSQTISERSVPLRGGTEGSAHHSAQENIITDGEANTLTDPGPATSNRAKDSDAENSEEELSESPILLILCR